jgi:hypothetical protein
VSQPHNRAGDEVTVRKIKCSAIDWSGKIPGKCPLPVVPPAPRAAALIDFCGAVRGPFSRPRGVLWTDWLWGTSPEARGTPLLGAALTREFWRSVAGRLTPSITPSGFLHSGRVAGMRDTGPHGGIACRLFVAFAAYGRRVESSIANLDDLWRA